MIARIRTHVAEYFRPLDYAIAGVAVLALTVAAIITLAVAL